MLTRAGSTTAADTKRGKYAYVSANVYEILALRNGYSVNPLVAMSLDSGMWLFLTVKSVGIGVGVAFLTLTKNFRASRLGLGVVFVGYSMLMCRHVYLYCNLARFV